MIRVAALFKTVVSTSMSAITRCPLFRGKVCRLCGSLVHRPG
jgi:hypothetical protein